MESAAFFQPHPCGRYCCRNHGYDAEAEAALLPHADYVTELAAMIGEPEPVMLTSEEGEKQLSPAALDFFRDNKGISNHLLHTKLLPELQYPNFRDAVPTLEKGDQSSCAKGDS